MNLTTMLRVIGRHRVLLLVGVLVAVAAAFATAFRVEDGALTPRTITEYSAPTQVLVSDPSSVFSTRGAPTTLVDGQTPPAARDLASATVVYAYLVSSAAITDLVEAQIGPLRANESLAAQQRTTQPTADTNTGTYRLPILEIVGAAPSKARAQEISRTAASIFTAFAAEQQDAAAVAPEARVQLQVIREGAGAPVDGTNPALPIIAVGVGVLLAFIALIFAVDNARTSRTPAPVAAAASTPRGGSGYPGARAVPAGVMSQSAAPPVSAGGHEHAASPFPESANKH